MKKLTTIIICSVLIMCGYLISNSHEINIDELGNTYKIDRVVDGDTVKIFANNKSYYVRLIGVNTPETVKPNTKPQFYGKEASTFLTNLLKGEEVPCDDR